MKTALLITLTLCVSLSLASSIPNVTQIVEGYGYPCEVHKTVTEDGWELTMQRIPHGKNMDPSTPLDEPKKVVFIQHGVLGSSAGWVMNYPNESLPFIMADAGYDVWLGNNRGNDYSDSSTRYNSSNPLFWAWSWDQMAQFDLDSMLGTALNVSGQQQLTYIGHSQGTIEAFAAFSHYPHIAAKVNFYVGLAPIIFIEHITNKMLIELSRFHFDFILQKAGVNEFNLEPEFLHEHFPLMCKAIPKICTDVWKAYSGDNCCLNYTRDPQYLEYMPQFTSVQNMAHMAQMIRSGDFQMYDYGSQERNQQHYNSSTPPMYDVRQFPVPVALFHGGVDQLADPTDYANLRKLLPDGIVKFEKFIPQFGHFDFPLAPQAYDLVYEPMLNVLKEFGL